MTHDPDHDLRALNPHSPTTNGLSDRRLDEAYRAAQRPTSGRPDGPDRASPPVGLARRWPLVAALLAALAVLALVANLVAIAAR